MLCYNHVILQLFDCMFLLFSFWLGGRFRELGDANFVYKKEPTNAEDRKPKEEDSELPHGKKLRHSFESENVDNEAESVKKELEEMEP